MKLPLPTFLALLALVLADGTEAGSKKPFGRPGQHQHRLLAKRVDGVTPVAKNPFSSWASKDGLVGFAPKDVSPAMKLPDASVVDTAALQKALEKGYSLLSDVTAVVANAAAQQQDQLKSATDGAANKTADAKSAAAGDKDQVAAVTDKSADAKEQAADTKDKAAAAVDQTAKLVKSDSSQRRDEDPQQQASDASQAAFRQGFEGFKDVVSGVNGIVPGGLGAALNSLTKLQPQVRQNESGGGASAELKDLASLVNPFIGTSIATYGNVFVSISACVAWLRWLTLVLYSQAHRCPLAWPRSASTLTTPMRRVATTTTRTRPCAACRCCTIRAPARRRAATATLSRCPSSVMAAFRTAPCRSMRAP
jgi:hypothetical protein